MSHATASEGDREGSRIRSERRSASPSRAWRRAGPPRSRYRRRREARGGGRRGGGAPQSASLKLPIYREAGEPRHWNRKAREALRRVRRQIVAVDRAGRDGVVAEHLLWLVGRDCDERFRDAGFMVLAREARQILVERRLAAGEAASIVGSRQRFDPPAIAHRVYDGLD